MIIWAFPWQLNHMRVVGGFASETVQPIEILQMVCFIALEIRGEIGQDLLDLCAHDLKDVPVWFFILLLLCLQTDGKSEMVQLFFFLASVVSRSPSAITKITLS
jgi:hypothetical protein